MFAENQAVAKTRELHAAVDVLVEWVREAVRGGTPMHVMENRILRQLLAMGRQAIQLVFELSGPGDVGARCELPDGRTLRRLQGQRARSYQSVFGEFSLQRYVYAEREGQKQELVPLDAHLGLPEGKVSFLLQDFDQALAVEEPYGQVKRTIGRILGVDQHVDTLERMNRKMGEAVEPFHGSQQPPPAEEEGAILVETADGKGIPIRRAADASPIQDHQRRFGPKPDRKKIATVASVYTVDPVKRTPEDVVQSLFREPNGKDQAAERQPDRPRPRHRRIRACLSFVNGDGHFICGRAAMFGWMSDEISCRNAGGKKPLVCIMDGEQSLWRELEVFQSRIPRVEILDLLHVTSRLWDAAHLFLASGSREAGRFVRDRLTRILHGEVAGVVRGLRRLASVRGLEGKRRKTLNTICGYFENNRQRMRYHEYLAAGYPIASGVIEGACRHVVKDRMERTGMNWVLEGAQPMLGLRCIALCDQWHDFLEFYIARELRKAHPHRSLIEQLPWNVAA